MIVRQRLLTRLIQLWKEDQLVEKIDRLPIELSPRKSHVMGRCCIHKGMNYIRYSKYSFAFPGHIHHIRKCNYREEYHISYNNQG